MTLERRVIPGLFASAFLVALANGQIITVTTSRDVIDVPASATVADLPGPDGKVSMNEALRASDNTPGRQTIGFAIPRDDWWLPNIFPGQVLLQSSFGWRAFEPVTIDGTTQTVFTGDTYPDGNEMALDGLSLNLNGDGSELFGFHGSTVNMAGNACEVHDNTGGMYITVGPFNSGSTVHDNEAGTIRILYSDDNVVVRNTTQRVRVTGLNATDYATGNRIGGLDPADRNFITGWGNVGEHGEPGGDTVELYYTDGTLIENNYIGTTPDGMAVSNHASTVGIGVFTDNRNLTIRNNLIATQSFWAGGTSGPAGGTEIWLQMSEGGSNIRIVGNTLGLNALGEPVLAGNYGIMVSTYPFEDGADLIQIGGPNPGEGNVIAGHRTGGILMEFPSGITPVGSFRVSGNSIYGNGEIGVDLMPNTWDFGPTPNDPLDADEGANGLQNYPVVAAAMLEGATLRVTGTLHSEPLGSFTLELFASAACDASGFGQAEVFLGWTSVSTDAAGDTAFDVTVPALAPAGWVVSATATLEPLGATSEFSACVPIEGGAAATFCDGSEATPCPCGNAGSSGAGCDIAQGTGGVTLALTSFSPDGSGAGGFVLEGTGYPPATSPTAVVIRSTARLATPSTFGDGLMCVAPPIVRLGATQASGGASTHSGSHGAGAGTFHYQVWFRNEPAAFCDPLAAFNLSNGLTLVWP